MTSKWLSCQGAPFIVIPSSNKPTKKFKQLHTNVLKKVLKYLKRPSPSDVMSQVKQKFILAESISITELRSVQNTVMMGSIEK